MADDDTVATAPDTTQQQQQQQQSTSASDGEDATSTEQAQKQTKADRPRQEHERSAQAPDQERSDSDEGASTSAAIDADSSGATSTANDRAADSAAAAADVQETNEAATDANDAAADASADALVKHTSVSSEAADEPVKQQPQADGSDDQKRELHQDATASASDEPDATQDQAQDTTQSRPTDAKAAPVTSPRVPVTSSRAPNGAHPMYPSFPVAGMLSQAAPVGSESGGSGTNSSAVSPSHQLQFPYASSNFIAPVPTPIRPLSGDPRASGDSVSQNGASPASSTSSASVSTARPVPAARMFSYPATSLSFYNAAPDNPAMVGPGTSSSSNSTADPAFENAWDASATGADDDATPSNNAANASSSGSAPGHHETQWHTPPGGHAASDVSRDSQSSQVRTAHD